MYTQLLRSAEFTRTGSLIFFMACLITAPAPAEDPLPSDAPQPVNLSSEITEGDVQNVKVVFELDGTLALKSDTPDPVKVPVQAKARLSYDEKVVKGSTAKRPWIRASVRAYQMAEANIKLPEQTVTPTLRDEREIIVSSADAADDVVLFSPLGPVTRDELDLIDVPANSAIINGLLPNRTVRHGETWQLKSALTPVILGLDAIAEQEITCRLAQLNDESAVVELEGTVNGASGGVATEISLAAKYAFERQAGRIGWFAMSLKENRSVGHAQPGLDGTIRLQMALTERTESPVPLHADVLADLQLSADPHIRLLEFVSPNGNFELLMNRKWHEMLDQKDACILRLVDRGDLLAQCNLTALPPMEDGVPFTLNDFQNDIEKVLDDEFGEFVTATEKVNEHGLHVMRVVVNGMASEVPIHWIYYHLTNEQGRRASCVFTFESDLMSRFGAADQTLVSSFRFRENTKP